MLLSKQQQYLLDAVQRLGGLSRGQLAALLRTQFCRQRPEVAPRLTEALLRQLRFGNTTLRLEGDMVTLPHIRADPRLTEAVDVMLELSEGAPLDFDAHQPPPILLRFSVPGKRIALFAVACSGANLAPTMFGPTERVILLHSGDGRPDKPPIGNRCFYAIPQADGAHRFFSSEDLSQKTTGGT